MLLLIGFTCGAVFTTGVWMLVTEPEKYFGKGRLLKKKTRRNEADVSSGFEICNKQMSSTLIVAQDTNSVKEE